MGVPYNPAYKYKLASWFSGSGQFKRSKRKTRSKKIQRKIKLKIKHILVFFLGLMGIFYLLQQSYLFLITWDKLNVNEVQIVCGNPEIKENLHRFFENRELGNLLLVNIHNLQHVVKSHSWIKEVRVRKIFPSSLKIHVTERIPQALLQKKKVYLIDSQGVLLEPTHPKLHPDLPLILGSHQFQNHSSEKLELALRMLQSVKPSLKKHVEVIDVSGYENVSIKLKNSPVWVKLGDSHFSSKLRLYQDLLPKFQKKYGPLQYVDLRFFQDRVIIKPGDNPDVKSPLSYKEAN
ncbi:cell division protein FtsQ/DivIB [bacterium]|nr:cell division protein FtsQ/DivIB [bacterium]